MVGVARVAKTEHDSGDQDEPEGRAVGEVGDPVVEPEHQRLTFGRARTVMAAPARRMTRALKAGSNASAPRSNETRANARFASTARRPTPVIARARGRG